MQNYSVAYDSDALVSYGRFSPTTSSLVELADVPLSLADLSDAALLREVASRVTRERVATASLLVYLAEVDARQLYRPIGYPSMYAYCVDELHLSEDAAKKRIQAARAMRQFPVLLTALAEGRLHLGAVCLLAPHLNQENVDAFVEAASHKPKSEIETWLLCRTTTSALPADLRLIPMASDIPQGAPGHLAASAPLVEEGAPGHLENSGGRVEPSWPCRLLQLRISKDTEDKLRYAQALLSHAVPSGDVAQVFDRALDTLIAHLEKRKFGANRPRSRRPSTDLSKRYVPLAVRRSVWERDQGRCTFVGTNKIRCKATRFLEFDHVDPVARGGLASVENLRLRCRAHNQYEADCAFGSDFMKRKRQEAGARKAATERAAREQLAKEAKERAAKEREAKEQAAKEQAVKAETAKQVQDVAAGLRNLGCSANEARRVAALTQTPQNATLEERMRAALNLLCRRST